MPWHSPITWLVNQLVTDTDLNEQVRDNLSYLKQRVDAPASAQYTLNETADYTTASTTFVDVDATRLAFTLNTSGSAVLIGFYGTFSAASSADTLCYLDVALDGVRVGGDDGLALIARKNGSGTSLQHGTLSFTALVPTLSAGEHTFKLQWRVSGGTMILRARAGSSGVDVHPQFWVREI
ncbi:hypothetical protein VZO05_10425 [Aggregatilineales bacterium SYSU G02658]